MENKFDKEIEDLGWKKMQALLDKEKPVIGIVPPQYIDQKSGKNGSLRKRWALMALLFLSLTTCGVGSYYFFKIKPETQPVIAINDASEIKNNGQNLTQNNLSELTNATQKVIPNGAQKVVKNDDLTKWSNMKNTNLEKQNKLNNFIIKKENKIQNIDNQLITKNNDPVSVSQNIDSDKEIEGILRENKEQIMNEKLTNGSNVSNAVISEVKTQNQEEKLVEKNASENAEKIGERLPFEAFNPFVFEPIVDTVASIKERANPIINLKKNASKMLQKWQFGLTLGTHTEGVKRLDGYQIGLVLNRNLNRKWTFSTGLNYRKATIETRNNASFFAPYADKANSSAGVTTPSSTSFNLSKVVEVRLKDMKYLEMPIMINHLVNNRFSVFGGVKISYLLSKNWVNLDTTNANLYVITYGNQSNKIYNSSAIAADKSSSYFVNNSLDFAILGGINYRISRHFDVSVRYDFGLKNILKQNNASVYNRYLGVNLNYYF